MNEEPFYYIRGGLSPLKAFEKGLLTEEQYTGFVIGNIIKYVVRAGQKTQNADEDLDKAIHYITILKEHYQNLNEAYDNEFRLNKSKSLTDLIDSLSDKEWGEMEIVYNNHKKDDWEEKSGI